jgi:hypothetical protein
MVWNVLSLALNAEGMAAFDVRSKTDAVNYRGIAVLPVISKIVEAVIRDRIQPLIHNMQNPAQRGFTKGSPLMNAALPVEEAYRILTDEKQNGHLVLLAAKAAFDKDIHSHLFRREFRTKRGLLLKACTTMRKAA